MTRSWYFLLIATVACARGSADPSDAGPDARVDATPCTQQAYYRDVDGDGHGDPASSVMACEPPAGTVASKDDCDDTTDQRHPGFAEICDALDNDCSAATTETCPAGCTPVRRQPPDDRLHAYLVCNIVTTWTNARTICNNAMYKLVQIDDAAENAYVRTTGDAGFGTGVEFHIGGTDSVVEGAWLWDGGVQFWQGGSAGVPVGGRYQNWDLGEPNNSGGTEDCSHMKVDGLWNDEGCGSGLRFICRR